MSSEIQVDPALVQHLLEKINYLESSIQNLSLLPEDVVNKVNQLGESVRHLSQTPALVPKIIMPEKFDGCRDGFRAFMAQIELVFSIQAQRYASDEVKISTIGTLLSGQALKWMTPMLENREKFKDVLCDYSRFKSCFRDAFAPVEQVMVSANRLRRLNQGRRKVSEYAAEFRLVASDLSFNDSALLDQFHHGLSKDVKNLMVNYEYPKSLDEAITLAIRCDHRLIENHLNVSASSGIVPMDLDHVRRGPLTKEERDNRIRNKLCIVCGSADHWKSNCPVARKKGKPNEEIEHRSLYSCNSVLKSCSQKSLLLDGKLKVIGHWYNVKLFVDNGADVSFMDIDTARELGISFVSLQTPVPIKLASKKSRVFNCSYKTEEITLVIGEHREHLQFWLIPLHHPIILGLSWLEKHNPAIDWHTKNVQLSSEYCRMNCLPQIDHDESMMGARTSDETNVDGEGRSTPSTVASLTRGLVSPRGRSPTGVNSSEFSLPAPEHQGSEEEENPIMDSQPSPLACYELAKECYPFFEPLEESNVDRLPDEIADYVDVFEGKEADKLPGHSEYDCAIEFVPGSTPPYGKVYQLSREEDSALKEWLDENLEKGFIRKSSSPFGAPCFFVRKKDGSLRLCMDYRGLNKITVKNRYPLPLIGDLIQTLAKGKIYTTLDLKGAYNLLRIREFDEFKTAFVTKYGQFEFLVMPFGLANAPAHFQSMMDSIFKSQIGAFVLVYIDDIVIYSQDIESHWQHVRTVLQILRDNQLVCKLKKCHFAQSTISYLGYIISEDGVRMDPRKVRSIVDWPTPKSVKEIQKFLGLANFYRRFIPNFASITQPLTALLKKDCKFVWSDVQEEAFELLKATFMTYVLLQHPDPDKPFVLEVDASDFGLGAVLSQIDEDQNLRPVSFYSRQMCAAERNYPIYDKELLAVFAAFKEWRHLLLSSKEPISVITDHKNLEYFKSSKQLTRRQARWAEFLAEFHFTLIHRPGRENFCADALSRRPDYFVPNENGNFFTLLHPDLFKTMSLNAIRIPSINLEVDPNNDWPLVVGHHIRTGEWIEGLPEDILRICKKEASKFLMENFILLRLADDGRTKTPYLPFRDRLVNIRRFHDGLGHLRAPSILDLIKRRYWWPRMDSDIREYIERCPHCQLDQSSSRSHADTPIRPIPPVALPFERWGIDFVQDLPETSRGNRHIITAIDYGTRWVVAKAVPRRDSETVARFLYEDIMLNYGVPFEIITDRASAFLSEAVVEFEKLQKIHHHASTPYHPCTNGMVERMHASLGHAITTLTDGHPENWDDLLPQAVFGLRVRIHSVTRRSPFYLMYGVHPKLPGDLNEWEKLRRVEELERLENEGEFIAREFEELGFTRRAAYERSRVQAEKMKRRYNLNPDSPDYYFKIGDWVKMKHHGKTKFEFDWKGPYTVVDVGFPGTYWLMTPNGRRFDNTINESDLAPWLAPVQSNTEYFYDGRHEGGDSVNELPNAD